MVWVRTLSEVVSTTLGPIFSALLQELVRTPNATFNVIFRSMSYGHRGRSFFSSGP